MNLQFVMDGTLAGAMIALGAIGVTLTYSVLQFSNFAHGELISIGAYITYLVAAAISATVIGSSEALAVFSFGWNVLLAAVVAMAVTGILAWGLDWLVFARLRAKGMAITLVMASFGASMALRAALEFIFSSRPLYYTQELQIARAIGAGILVTPDQLLLVAITATLVGLLYVVWAHTALGRAMRAVSENPALAEVCGIDVPRVVRVTWYIGGALASAAGLLLGLLVQVRPQMGFEMLLPLFAAAILGGIGSVPGALCGGLIVGLSQAATVQFIGAEWRAGVAFVILLAVLLIRPHGLFGRRS
jgi:branched-chain amino acid transport system permease protein